MQLRTASRTERSLCNFALQNLMYQERSRCVYSIVGRVRGVTVVVELVDKSMSEWENYEKQFGLLLT